MGAKGYSILKEALDRYEVGLEQSEREEDIHSLLAANPVLVTRGINGPPIPSEAVSKFPLGNDFITDFIIFGFRSEGWPIHLTFVELESPTAAAFTKSRKPSSTLTQAMLQVNDWQNWLNYHLDEFCLSFPKQLTKEYGNRDLRIELRSAAWEFKIVIGRKKEMKEKNNIYRHSHYKLTNGSVEIMTYDRILFRIKDLTQMHGSTDNEAFI
jgi:hypothetical protein